MVALADSSSPVTPQTHTPVIWVYVSGLRYYRPELGRWMNRDPLGKRAYASGVLPRVVRRLNMTWNGSEYAFCDSNPVGAYDLLGLCVVYVNCVLKSEKGACHKDCLYECREEIGRLPYSRRELPYNTGELCADVAEPYIFMYSKREPGIKILGICCKKGKCDESFKDTTNVGGPDQMRCSRQSCKAGCKFVAKGAKRACKATPNPPVCKALVEGTKQFCLQGCEHCQDP